MKTEEWLTIIIWLKALLALFVGIPLYLAPEKFIEGVNFFPASRYSY